MSEVTGGGASAYPTALLQRDEPAPDSSFGVGVASTLPASIPDDPVPGPVAGLVYAAAGGDATAWNSLVRRFNPMVWAVARSCGLSAADAGEVVQTAWLRLVERLETIHQPDRVGAWLATTARREALKLATGHRRIALTDDDRVFDEHPAVCDVPGQRALTEERDRLLHQAFMRLPLRARVLLTMLAFDRTMSYKEISTALGMPIGSIGPTRGRYLAQLREHALELGLSPDDVEP